MKPSIRRTLLLVLTLPFYNFAAGQELEVNRDSAQIFRSPTITEDLKISKTRLNRLVKALSKEWQSYLQADDKVVEAYRELKHEAWNLESDEAMQLAIDWLHTAREQADLDYEQHIQQRVHENLLPRHQQRLRQLLLWNQINGRLGFSEFLLTEKMQDFLGITSKQKDQIKQRAGQLQAEFERELLKLRQEFRKKLEKKMTSGQRQKLSKNLGEPSRVGSPQYRF